MKKKGGGGHLSPVAVTLQDFRNTQDSVICRIREI